MVVVAYLGIVFFARTNTGTLIPVFLQLNRASCLSITKPLLSLQVVESNQTADRVRGEC